MVPLAVGLSLDVGLLAKIIFDDPDLGRWIGMGLLALAAISWYIVPLLIKGYLNAPAPQVHVLGKESKENVKIASSASH
jgi:hypothetical protein